MISNIVRGVASEKQNKLNTEVISTEEIKYHIKLTNTKILERIRTNHPAKLRPRR